MKTSVGWTRGGKGKIFTQKFDYSRVKPKVPFKENENHVPGGGRRTIWKQKVDFSHVKPKIPVKNQEHQPGGGKVGRHISIFEGQMRPGPSLMTLMILR
jgi:hypothetical protein